MRCLGPQNTVQVKYQFERKCKKCWDIPFRFEPKHAAQLVLISILSNRVFHIRIGLHFKPKFTSSKFYGTQLKLDCKFSNFKHN